MARVLIVVPAGSQVGLTSAALGLMQASSLNGQRARFVKPISQPGAGKNDTDYTVRLVEQVTGQRPPQPISQAKVEKYLAAGQTQELLEEVVSLVAPFHYKSEVIIVEGLIQIGCFHYDHELNRQLIETLDADAVLVAKAGQRSVSSLAHEVAMHRQSLGSRVVGCLINQVPSHDMKSNEKNALHLPELSATEVPDDVRNEYETALSAVDVSLAGCIPYVDLAAAPRVKDLVDCLDLELIGECPDLNRRLRRVIIGAMGVRSVIPELTNGQLLITGSDRHDLIVATALAEMSGVKTAGLLLTVGQTPAPEILQLCQQALNSGLPVLLTHHNTLEVSQQLMGQRWPIVPDDQERAQLIMHTVASNVDSDWLDHMRQHNRPRRLTPPAFRFRLIDTARRINKRIVLPEGEEPRTLVAAEICAERGIAQPVLIGDPERIAEVARSQGVELPQSVEIINPSEMSNRYVDEMVKIRQHKGLSPSEAEDALTDPVVLGCMMLALGEVDGLVSGAVHTTANTIRPALQLVKTSEQASLVSSVFFMCLLDQVMVYGDCAVNRDPNAEELAEIALQSAASAEAFGIPPRVAMISYSTGSSGSGDDVKKVREATRIVRERRPDLEVDGPLQYDAAVTPDVAAKKAPDSPVAGRANVIVFPDLNTGNTTYKAVQRSANVVSIGPMLQGLRKPVNDLSRGALVEDIVYTIALTAIQAHAPAHEAYRERHSLEFAGSKLTIRSLSPQDEKLLKAFHETLSEETVRARYRRHFPLQARQNTVRLQAIVNADQIDEIVIGVFDDQEQELIAVGRMNIEGRNAETAIVVTDNWQGKGLARLLKEEMIAIGQKRGLHTLESSYDVMNRSAIELARHMGYRFGKSRGGEVSATLDL